jgi:hypothetical protein
MIHPTVNDIGRKVVYREDETGEITSFTDKVVFVRYGNDLHSKATRREDLEWLWRDPRRDRRDAK